MSIDNPALDRLRAGGTIGCFWLTLGSPPVAELIAEASPDAIVLDLQHGLWERGTLESAIGLIGRRSVPLVRVAENSLHAINTALDAGALGVVVPLIESAAEAAAAVAAAKYPPAGRRSGGGVRPLKDFKAYAAAADAATLVAVMIETRAGVENAAAIAAVPGVDLVLIGSGDLALSLGCFPEMGPPHEAAVQQVLAACRAAGTPCGVFTFHTTFAIERRRQGFQMVIIGTDNEQLSGWARTQIGRFAARPPAADAHPVKGAVALVTGTNRGIGPATVRALLAEGAAKVYCAARKASSNAALIAEAPDRLVPLALDVTDAAQIAAAAARCSDVSLLVNNAGVNFNTPLVGISGVENARAEMETNYFGTLAMCRAFAPVLKRNGGGTIVNMLSILSHVNLPLMGSLCASKAAALSLTQAVRAELGGQGTRVMGVLPGAVDTDMTAGVDIPKLQPAEVAAAIVHGLLTGAEEVYPGDMAAGTAAGLATDPKGVERQYGQFLPPPAA
jgi:2-keto-3-deoxy-L-rhamnonate aldolase RhmA/NAD(P)-dependent dehydrogenase (short-subunit alcohol dehydrogenase family)